LAEFGRFIEIGKEATSTRISRASALADAAQRSFLHVVAMDAVLRATKTSPRRKMALGKALG